MYLCNGNDLRCVYSRRGLTVYLGAGLGAVHYSVAAVEGERILQLGQTLLCELVSGVDHPAIRLTDRGIDSDYSDT